MLGFRQRYRQGADRAGIRLWSLVPLIVQPLVLEFGRALLTCLLVLLAMSLLAVHAAVLDEEAGRAVLELECVAPASTAVRAAFVDVNGHAAHLLISGVLLSDRNFMLGKRDAGSSAAAAAASAA
ncbi:hypothetical protein THAOC_23557, partial [Thalassiosira oceanica]